MLKRMDNTAGDYYNSCKLMALSSFLLPAGGSVAQTLPKQTVASICNELKSTAVCLLIVQVCDKSYNIEVDISTGRHVY